MDGCCGPHHTLLRSRTVLCCGPCSLTVHFRGPRPCSSAPPRRTGVVDPTTHSSAPVQYSAAAPAPLQYTPAGLGPVAQPPPTDGCCGPLHTLLCSRTVLCCGPCSLTVLCCTAAPGSGHLAFSRPPAPPVALGVTNGRTTPRSYAELTKTLISTPKTTTSTPESIMPTSLYLQPRGFREIRLPIFYSLSLRLTLTVSTPVVSFRSTHHSVYIV